MSLRQLSVQFCNLTDSAGVHLGELLANSVSGLEVMNVSGKLCPGAAVC